VQSAIAPSQNPPLKVLPGNSNKFKQIVMLVQSGLTAYGYYGGPLTGAVDEDTKAALRQMQQDNNLKVTGTVTAEVLNAFGISAQ
jgi:His-Xaa-Ser repeat protein HxsA